MKDLFTYDAIHLDAGEVLSGCARRSRLLRVRTGSAWVTIEGVRHDYWLSAGDALSIARGRLVVIEAQGTGMAAETGLERAPARRSLLSVFGAAARRALATLTARSASLTVRKRPTAATCSHCGA